MSSCTVSAHLGGWQNRVGGHHPIRVLLPNLGDEQGTHARSGTTTKGVGDLEALKQFTVLGLLAYDFQDLVDELGTWDKETRESQNCLTPLVLSRLACPPTLSVVSFCPIISRSTLTEHKIVRPEESSMSASLDGVHCARLQVDQYSARDVLALSGFIVVDVDAV